jgi:hypothetical protein
MAGWRSGLAACDGLWHLAPAAIQKGGGGGDPRGRGRILVPWDADQDLDRDSGMAARQRADVEGSTWQMGLALKVWRRPIAWVRARSWMATKNPRTVSRRGHLLLRW